MSAADERDRLQNMVTELLAVESGLSGWEMDFIESCEGRTHFSPKQAAKLEEIWNRVLG